MDAPSAQSIRSKHQHMVHNRRREESGHENSQTGIMYVTPSCCGVQHMRTNMPLSAVGVQEGCRPRLHG